MGTVEALNVNSKMVQWDGSVGEGVELTVKAGVALDEAYIGCSIAVNGVCLTATVLEQDSFTVGLAPETLRRTNLGALKPGSKVNLERALKADSRNSGHFVQGHVDCTGEIIEKWREGDSLWVKVRVPHDMIKYIVPKGFICIDGTSLTICEVDSRQDSSWFTFMLVAHTQQSVIIPHKAVGERVNVEVDVLAKMVERSLTGIADSMSSKDAEITKLKKRVDDLESMLYRIKNSVDKMPH
jgi:riboflavin synthase